MAGDREHTGDRDVSGARRSGGVDSGRPAAGQGEALSEWARVALSLQRSAGNRAVSAMLQRGKGGGTKAEQAAADKARRKAQEERKQASAGAAMKEKLAAGQGKREAAALEAGLNQKKATQKAAKVREIAATWRADIGTAVADVKALRHQKSTEGWSESRVAGINAGSNPGAGAAPIPGGSKNPIKFTVPSNEFGIERREVFTSIAGFDSSDSGVFKFRMADGIFIHGE